MAESKLTDLIAKLEAATGGSRELDAELMALFYVQDSRFIGCTCDCCPGGRHPDLVWVDPDTDKWVTTALAGYEFTTSLDAIVALIERKLPVWCIVVESTPKLDHPSGNKACARIMLMSGGGTARIAARTPPLALCVALLSALQLQGGSEQ